MGYSVRTVDSQRDLKQFLRIPRIVYKGDDHWVPPISAEVRRVLDPGRNPYFKTASLRLFLCLKDEQPVARTAVVISRRHEEKFGVKTAFFGFFESTNDQAATNFLFAEVASYCHSCGVEVLEGPFNPNHYSELGLQISHFETPQSFFQTYNPEYYHTLLAGAGFRQSTVLFTARNESPKDFLLHEYGPNPVKPQYDGYQVRTVDPKRLAADLDEIRSVLNDAFSSNWHFLEASQEEYQFSAKFLRLVTDPKLNIIVRHNGFPVGVLMCVLDINPLLKRFHGRVGPLKYLRFLKAKGSIRSLIVYAVGIRKAYHHTRVFSLLLNEMIRIAQSYDCLETTWMSRDNSLAIRSAERLGMRPEKHFAIYEKRLSGADTSLPRF